VEETIMTTYPGMYGRNWTVIVHNVVEISSYVPDLGHDIWRGVVYFVSNGQAFNKTRSIFVYGSKEGSHIVVNLPTVLQPSAYLTDMNMCKN
jgi:hypothetical protein